MTFMSPTFRLLLAVILIAGSAIMAPARAPVGPTTEIALCSGYDTAVITLDAQGNPVVPRHPCPECLPGMAAFLLPGQTTLPPAVARRLPNDPLPVHHLAVGHHIPPASARDPPLPV